VREIASFRGRVGVEHVLPGRAEKPAALGDASPRALC
jgi:hypothetical protein